MTTPSWYRPCTRDNLYTLFTCPVCKLDYQGRFYRRLSEPHPDMGNSARKKIIDLRACKSCHVREYQRQYHERLVADLNEAREKAYAKALKEGVEITDVRLIPKHLLPPKPKTARSRDPVLQACQFVRDDSRAKLKELFAKAHRERVSIALPGDPPDSELVTESNENSGKPQLIVALRATRKLLEARIALAYEITNLRKIDMQHPSTASDPMRLTMAHYITDKQKHTMMKLAAIANRERGCTMDGRGRMGMGRPLEWMPMFTCVVGDIPTESTLREQWRPYKEQAQHVIKMSRTYLRLRHTQTAKRWHRFKRGTLADTGDNGLIAAPTYVFTMEEFHLLRMEIARDCINKMDSAVLAGRSPGDYLDYQSDEVRAITRWQQLAQRLPLRELLDMFEAFDPTVKARMDLFGNKFVARNKRSKFQVAQKLDKNNVALPAPAVLLQDQ